jgi:hypothetical protein
MRDIYRHAAAVAVWLGEEDAHSAMALEPLFIQNLHTPGGSANEWRAVIEDPRWKAVSELARRPWWGRVWVIQEIAVAGQLIAVCGSNAQPWNVVYRNLKFVSDLESALGSGTVTAPDNSLQYAKQTCDFRKEFSQSSQSPSLDLLTLLQKFRHYEASDPRDKVYALLGLSTALIKPDYSISVRDAFKTVARYIVQGTNSLDILAYACPSHIEGAVPSWVPDWNKPMPDAHVPLRTSPLGTLEKLFSAGGQSNPVVSFSNNCDVIIVRGIFIDELMELSDVSGDQAISTIKLWHEQFKAISLTHNLHQYSGAGEREFFRTIIADTCLGSRANNEHIMRLQSYFYSTDQSQGDYEAAVTKLREDAVKIDRAVANREGEIVEITMDESLDVMAQFILKAVQMEVSPNPKKRPWFEPGNDGAWEDVLRATTTRRFFYTRTGLIGLCPGEAAVGDPIFVPLGASVPLLLKPAGAHYRLIGECYVNGFMDGKALRDLNDDHPRVQDVTIA